MCLKLLFTYWAQVSDHFNAMKLIINYDIFKIQFFFGTRFINRETFKVDIFLAGNIPICVITFNMPNLADCAHIPRVIKPCVIRLWIYDQFRYVSHILLFLFVLNFVVYKNKYPLPNDFSKIEQSRFYKGYGMTIIINFIDMINLIITLSINKIYWSNIY